MREQAAICSRFGVAWHRYGSLTLRERRVLLEVIAQEHDADSTVFDGPLTSTTPAPTRTGRNGERLERVC